ncbi:putative RNA-directed DNA polymerase, eukaryota, reverse transcriptase zinc-binding domain protein [Tanacetum coccineum]
MLIPKKKDPLGFFDFRPISLIGCVYKVISKILATRLAKVINSIIGPNQSAFIEGRQILYGCLVANEVIRMATFEKHELLLFKVDFEKAFDSVNWNFLTDVMRQMGFEAKWRNWISPCLSSATISVMINGSPSKEFKMERGLRQGLFKEVSLAESGVNVSLLQYADDALFFGEWLMGVGVPVCDVEAMASSIGCSHDSLPFIYLGLPVGKRMRLCEGWNVIINRFRDKLSCWNGKSLSVGGRLTLIKSILGSLPIYYLSLFKAPIKTILLDPKFGGLGVGCLQAKNLGLLGKWKWRFLTEDKALWNIVIKEFYGVDGGFNSTPNQFGCGIWTDIIKAVECIEGIDTSFKECKISDRWSLVNNVWGGNWSWRFPPRGRAIDDLASLTSSIGNLSLLMEGMDKWHVGEHHYWNSWIPYKSWWNLDSPVTFPSFLVLDIAAGTIKPNGNSQAVKVMQGVFQIALWALWKWRNRLVNASTDLRSRVKDEDIFSAIQRFSKTWIAVRLSSKSANWDVWISRPFDLFV